MAKKRIAEVNQSGIFANSDSHDGDDADVNPALNIPRGKNFYDGVMNVHRGVGVSVPSADNMKNFTR